MRRLRQWAALARQFHSLEDAPGAQDDAPDPHVLDDWARDQDADTRAAAQFVLSLWADGMPSPWRCGPFRLRAALDSWDAAHPEEGSGEPVEAGEPLLAPEEAFMGTGFGSHGEPLPPESE